MPKTCLKQRLAVLALLLSLTLLSSHNAFAQGKELPIENKPLVRSTAERVVIRTVPMQPTKGVLAVVLDPIIGGKVTIKDLAGKVLTTGDADNETGQAEFLMPRKKAYQVEVNSPGYAPVTAKSKVLTASAVVRLKLIPRFATLRLLDVPPNAQIFLDKQLHEYKDQAIFADLPPGEHSLQIKHPEYNDYDDRVTLKEAGATYDLTIRLDKVAKLNFYAPPNATVLIDGAVQGRVNADGQVKIDYELPQAGEHTLAVELLGFQTWTRKEMLAPGPRSIEVKLTPVVTSAGTSDSFDSLSLWQAPGTWKIVRDNANSKLQVNGNALGTLKDKIYRNFEVYFTVWLADGKGASWAVRADKEGKRYYLFHLTGTNAANGLSPRRFYSYLVQDGVISEVSTPTTVLTQLNNKDSYTIHLTVKSDYVITHEITSNSNGELNELGIYTDSSDTKERSLFGSFGFLSLKGESFLVDDFNLAPLQ